MDAGSRKGYPFVSILKGYLFCQKWYIKGAIKNFVGSSYWSYDQKQSKS